MYNIAEVHFSIFTLQYVYSYMHIWNVLSNNLFSERKLRFLVDISIKSADISHMYTFYSSFEIRHFWSSTLASLSYVVKVQNLRSCMLFLLCIYYLHNKKSMHTAVPYSIITLLNLWITRYGNYCIHKSLKRSKNLFIMAKY